MNQNKYFKIAGISAIVNALLFFLYSILNLLLFAVQQKVLSPSQNSLLLYIITNLKPILILSYLLLFFSSLLIYIGFLGIAKNYKQVPLSFSIYLIILSSILFLAGMLLSIYLPSILASFGPLEIKHLDALIGLSFLIFGILIFTIKAQLKENIIIALGILYILEGLSLISSLSIPIRVVDFTIATKILEAVLFFALAKKINKNAS